MITFKLWCVGIRSVSQYLKVLKNIEAKGAEYPAKEASRLERMQAGVRPPSYLAGLLMLIHASLALQKVSPAKKDEFQVRLNVLSSFSSEAATS